MIKTRFFTIIIPTYNRAHLIQETLDSVLNQSFKDWECIIVDDGSSDNTKDIVQTYCFKDSRFRYIYQDNAERSAARNNGIINAQGEWICFLDSDDLYLNSYLDELIYFIQKQNTLTAYFIFCDTIIFQDNNTIENNATIPFDNSADWFYLNPVSTSRLCINKSILNEFKFNEKVWIGEDTILLVSMLTQYKCLHLNKPLIIYRVHENNSVTPFSGSCFNRYYGLKYFFQSDLSNEISNQVKKKIVSETEFRIAEYYKFKKKYLMSIMFTFKSILSDFKHEQRKMRFFFLLNLLPGFNLFWKLTKTSK